MRDPLTVLLAIGIFVVGGYAGFVWLANPSTTGHDATSRPLHAETTLKANVPSEADRTAQESSSKRLAETTPAVRGSRPLELITILRLSVPSAIMKPLVLPVSTSLNP